VSHFVFKLSLFFTKRHLFIYLFPFACPVSFTSSLQTSASVFPDLPRFGFVSVPSPFVRLDSHSLPLTFVPSIIYAFMFSLYGSLSAFYLSARPPQLWPSTFLSPSVSYSLRFFFFYDPFTILSRLYPFPSPPSTFKLIENEDTSDNISFFRRFPCHPLPQF